MAATHVFAGIPVSDIEAAVGWYTRLFGRPPDLVPHAQEAAWRLTDTGWVYVVADAPRAGTASHTVLVDDLDAFRAELEARGIAPGPVETIGAGVRRTTIGDPDGNRFSAGQPPS
jgi:catechol 2,3-dioxygenase-like lactoylglutathione lyase family enzyme